MVTAHRHCQMQSSIGSKALLSCGAQTPECPSEAAIGHSPPSSLCRNNSSFCCNMLTSVGCKCRCWRLGSSKGCILWSFRGPLLH